jgi:hypothetical protein
MHTLRHNQMLLTAPIRSLQPLLENQYQAPTGPAPQRLLAKAYPYHPILDVALPLEHRHLGHAVHTRHPLRLPVPLPRPPVRERAAAGTRAARGVRHPHVAPLGRIPTGSLLLVGGGANMLLEELQDSGRRDWGSRHGRIGVGEERGGVAEGGVIKGGGAQQQVQLVELGRADHLREETKKIEQADDFLVMSQGL